MTFLRKLIWLYLVLLVFEGALRKWVVPALDTPLLIIRDPVVVWIYYQAWKNQLSFNNAFFIPNLVLAVLTATFSLLFGMGNLVVTVYGLRTDYLQIPLIFLMPQILNRDDVIAIGRFLLYSSIPMAGLAILQFSSSPDSLVNKGAFTTHFNTVRPSGTFSYITGLSAFLTLTAAFLWYGYLQARTYKIWLTGLVTFSILITAGCSGSRLCLASIGVVTAVAILCVLKLGRGGVGILVAALLIAFAVAVLSTTSVFHTGVEQLSARLDETGAVEADQGGFLGRFFSTFLTPVLGKEGSDNSLAKAPLFGHGLGLGTNAGFSMINPDLEWPEEEWTRLIFECGPIFGLLLCVFRIALSVTIALRSFRAFNRGNILPMLIFAASGLLILNGQWGVPTILGFSIFGAGLALAACVEPPEEDDEDEEDEDESEPSPAAHMMG